jgi:hypothetical protein
MQVQLLPPAATMEQQPWHKLQEQVIATCIGLSMLAPFLAAQGLVWGVVLGKVLEALSGWAGGSNCTEALLLHGLLFAVHQDPAYVSHGLAPMVAAYSLTHAWSLGTAASSRQFEQLEYPELLVQGAKQTEYFMHCVPCIVMVYQVIKRIAGPPEKARRTPATAAAAHRGLGLSSNPLSMRSSSATRLTTCSSARSSSTSDSCPGSMSSLPGQEGAPARLSQGYVVKLALVKCCDALFTAILAWQLVLYGAQQTPVDTFSSDSSSSSWQSGWPAGSHVLAVYAATQVLHAVSCLLQPAWLKRHLGAVNRMSFCSTLAAHACLLLPAVAGSTSQAASNRANMSKAWPQMAYRSFTALATSLAVHEAPLPEMMVELTAGAALFRWLHTQLLELSGTPSDDWSILALPEYALVVIISFFTYPIFCLGRHDQDGPSNQQQCRLRRTRSSSNQRASVADSSGTAEITSPGPVFTAPSARASLDLSVGAMG